MGIQQDPYTRIKLLEGSGKFLRQGSEDADISDFYSAFYQCFVLWFVCSGWQNSHSVVISEGFKVLVEFGFIAVTLGNSRLQIIRDNSVRCTAEIM